MSVRLVVGETTVPKEEDVDELRRLIDSAALTVAFLTYDRVANRLAISLGDVFFANCSRFSATKIADTCQCRQAFSITPISSTTLLISRIID